jgi:hypothetical protein
MLEVTLPVLGFGVGALPHLLYAIPRGAASPPFPGSGWPGLVAHLGSLARAWAPLLGVPADLPGWSALLLTVLLTTAYVLLVVAALRWVRESPSRGGADLAALVLLVATNLGAVIVGKYGDLLWPRAFYLSPIWTALPALAGAGLSALRTRHLAAGLAGLLLAIHAVGIARGLGRTRRRSRTRRSGSPRPSLSSEASPRRWSGTASPDSTSPITCGATWRSCPASA